MTLTATTTSQTMIPCDSDSFYDQKVVTSAVNPEHFVELLRKQVALIRETPLPPFFHDNPCDLTVFGATTAVSVRKLPDQARAPSIVASAQRLTSAFRNYLSNIGSAFHLADAICDFCHDVRMARFMAPPLLQSSIDHESETGILLPLSNAFQALTQNDRTEALACVQQLRNSNLYRDAVSLCIIDTASNYIRRHLHSLQKMVASGKSRNDSDSFRPFLPWSPWLSLLLESSTLLFSWIHKFVVQGYVPEGHEDSLMSNLCLLCGAVVIACQDLTLASTAGESRVALSRFWISIKALIDLLANEEQFGDEPLQGTHTGRHLLYSSLKRMQSARNELRKFLV